ncbi:MAG: lytic murein transglycosylase [Patescibacteria group bacterium]
MKKVFSFLAFSLLILGPSMALAQASCPANISGYTDEQLQEFLAVCEKEIAENQAKLTFTQKQATSIERVIAELKYKIQKSELEIKARNIKITQLGDDISVRNKNINVLSEKIDKMRDSLSELLRKTDEVSAFTPAEALLSNSDLSEFFANLDDYEVIRGHLRNTLLEISEVKTQTEAEKARLEQSKVKEGELKYQQEQEKKRTNSLKSEQEHVLKLTRAEESAFKKEIADKERVKNEIRNRIFKTVGGQELRFEEALKLVRQYEARVGVNAALTLAILTQESSVNGLIGKNIGKCTYNQSASNESGTVMAPSQQASFLAIMNELGLNANTTPVSCPIYSDGSYGGAMGPSQFMPNTWWNVNTGFGYKQRVAEVMGVTVPSPFNNLDAFTGTALYLSDALERCRSAFTSTFELRACTAAKYYAGLTASGSRLARHMNPASSYGYKVAMRAAQFEKDITLLDQ